MPQSCGGTYQGKTALSVVWIFSLDQAGGRILLHQERPDRAPAPADVRLQVRVVWSDSCLLSVDQGGDGPAAGGGGGGEGEPHSRQWLELEENTVSVFVIKRFITKSISINLQHKSCLLISCPDHYIVRNCCLKTEPSNCTQVFISFLSLKLILSRFRAAFSKVPASTSIEFEISLPFPTDAQKEVVASILVSTDGVTVYLFINMVLRVTLGQRQRRTVSIKLRLVIVAVMTVV